MDYVEEEKQNQIYILNSLNMKKYIYNNINWVEFLLAFLILTFTSTGVLVAMLLAILFIVTKGILVKYNKVPYTLDSNPFKTLGAVLSASMLKFILTIIF